MKITRKLGIVGLAAVAALTATGAPAYAKTPSHTVEGVHAHVDARTQHITTRMQALKSRLTANPRVNAASKTTVSADITKVLADTATWRRLIDAATTMTAVRAAAPAREAVMADLTKLRNDLKAAHAAKIAGH
jgi:hypothetical protein